MQKKWVGLAIVATIVGFAGSQCITQAQGNGRQAAKRKPILTCNLAVMTMAQREHYEAQKARLRRAVKRTKELPNGYSFQFASEPNLLVAAAEFIEGERQCCPFFTFNLEVAPNKGGTRLKITGPKNSKELIKEALAD